MNVKMDVNLFDKRMIEAGLKQVKDIIYEVKPGFLKEHVIVDECRGVDEDVKREDVIAKYGKIKEKIPDEWKRMIENECANEESGKMPDLLFECNGEWKNLKSAKTKELYRRFLRQAVQAPASLTFWCNTLPNITKEKIWKHVRIKRNSIGAEYIDFMIRHNQIYTNEVVHQFDKGVGRLCDVCSRLPENLLHMFVKCDELKEFHTKLKDVLTEKLGLIWDERDCWESFILFGEWERSRVKNAALCRYLLSHARWAIKSRRNIAHFEKNVKPVWAIFRSMVRLQVSYRYMHGAAGFTLLFLRDNTLIKMDEGKNLVWDFDVG